MNGVRNEWYELSMMVFHPHELLCFYQNFVGRLSSFDVLVQLHFIPSETQLMGKHNVSCVSVCDCMDTILSINTRARNIHSYVKTMDGIFVLFQRIQYHHVTSRQREKDGKEHDTHTHAQAHTYRWNNVRHSSGADSVDGVYFCAKDQNKDFSASKKWAMTTTTTPPIPMRMKTEAAAAADQYDDEYKNHNDSETGSIQHKRCDGIVATTVAEISPTKSMNIQLRPCSLMLLLLLLLQSPLRLLFIVLFSIASSLFLSCSRRSAEDRIISLEIHSVVRSLCVCVCRRHRCRWRQDKTWRKPCSLLCRWQS